MLALARVPTGALSQPSVMPSAQTSSPSTPPAPLARVALIPMDDRPATELFPRQVAAICGASVELPPQQLLGHFTRPGNAEALGRWLLDLNTRGIAAIVVSADMLAYGGLVASRTSATSLADARAHMQALVRFHEQNPAVRIYVFGTIMRLAPTETPQAEPYLDALTNYAQQAAAVHPTASDSAALAQWRAAIPDAVFWDYIGARARDLAVDEQLVTLAAQGSLTWLAITQDDAGAPDGLQLAEQRALMAHAQVMGASDRVLFNPGADEMGMVALTRAIEDAAGWYPRASIAYSNARGSSLQDPLEDVSAGQTIATLERALRLQSSDGAPDFTLSVFTPHTPDADRAAYFADVSARLKAGEPLALADLTFIDDNIPEERIAVETLRDAGVADKPIAFASWNTTANTVGTALSTATCNALAAHFGIDTSAERETFLYQRYVDDYAYRLLVRPALNDELKSMGYDTFALGSAASEAEAMTRHELWPLAVDLYDRSFSERWTRRELGIYLPWQRTFEVNLDVALAPR